MRRYFLRRLKLTHITIFGALVCVHLLVSHFSSTDLIDCSNLSNNIKIKNYLRCIENEGLKSIQVLTHFYHWKEWHDEQLGTKPFEKCKEKRCFAFRYNSNRQEALEESNGVIVHAPNFLYMPSRRTYKRNPKQLWSLFTIESQRYSFCLLKFTLNDLDDWFNLTKTIKDHYAYMKYDLKKLDQYEQYRKAYEQKQQTPPMTHKPRKKRLALWLVSHCSTPNKRESFAVELAKYIDDLDIYGKCDIDNSKPDPCKTTTKSQNETNCMIDLYNSYKFYLSLENSNCDSYITEKYFKFYESDLLFKVNIVPIVRGAFYSQYLARAPSNHSFIYADHFKSVKSLAEYILYLDRNNTAYLEYFEWKRDLFRRLERGSNDLFLKEYEFDPLCDLCEKLHDEGFMNNTGRNKVVKISEIYNPSKDCFKEEGATEEVLAERLEENCYWAEFHLSFKWFWHIFYRIF